MPAPLVIVTGASHGIGEALAKRFAADGHALLLIARQRGALEASGDAPVRWAEADVADYAALDAAIGDAEKSFGPAECLVNNAGFVHVGTLREHDPGDLAYQIDVMLKGVVNGTRIVLPGMAARKRGTIINVSSIGDRKPGPMAEVYHATKAAVRSLSESLQQVEAANNVRIINVAPGLVRTHIHADMGISFEEYTRLVGNPQFIEAEQLAEVIHFCWRQPQSICIRDIVVMPTSSAY